MQKRKQIAIQKKESQRSYFEDLQPQPEKPVKEAQVRKSILVPLDLEQKIKDYIYQKRTQGDIYYTQTHLFKEALYVFLDTPNS